MMWEMNECRRDQDMFFDDNAVGDEGCMKKTKSERIQNIRSWSQVIHMSVKQTNSLRC